MYHQGYDGIAANMGVDNASYGNQIHFATVTGIREAAEYYQEPLGIENRSVFDRDNTLSDFHQWLDECRETPMLGFGWTDYAAPVWETAAVAHYPYLVKKNDWFTSRYLTLSKSPTEGAQYLLNELSTDSCCYVEGQEWGQACSFSCDSLPKDVEALGVVVQFHNEVEANQCVAVIEVHDAATDSLLLWHSSLPEEGHFMPGDHAVADAILFSDDFKPEGKYIKAYLWNQGKKPLVVTKLSYYFTKKSPVLTGLYEPLN
jgi:hypothetical protein